MSQRITPNSNQHNHDTNAIASVSSGHRSIVPQDLIRSRADYKRYPNLSDVEQHAVYITGVDPSPSEIRTLRYDAHFNPTTLPHTCQPRTIRVNYDRTVRVFRAFDSNVLMSRSSSILYQNNTRYCIMTAGHIVQPGDMPHRCPHDGCHYSAVHPEHVASHQRTKHEEYAIFCHERGCERAFAQANKFKDHLITMHGLAGQQLEARMEHAVPGYKGTLSQ